MKYDLQRRETYVLHRVNAALTRLIQAESDGEITRANKWVRAWFQQRHALLAIRRRGESLTRLHSGGEAQGLDARWQ